MAKKSTYEDKRALDGLKLEEKKALLKPTFEIPRSSVWKFARDEWAKASFEDRAEYVCGLVFMSGMNKPGIKKFFNLKDEMLDEFDDIVEQTAAILQAKIQTHQINWAYTSNQFAAAKFFLGKQFANQVEHPVHEGVEAGNSNEIVLRVERGDESAPEAETKSTLTGMEALGMGVVKLTPKHTD
jgi:hypothetical protein